MSESVVRMRRPSRLPSGRLVGPDERDRWVRRVRRGAPIENVCEALGIREGTLRAWMRDLAEREAEMKS